MNTRNRKYLFLFLRCSCISSAVSPLCLTVSTRVYDAGRIHVRLAIKCRRMQILSLPSLPNLPDFSQTTTVRRNYISRSPRRQLSHFGQDTENRSSNALEALLSATLNLRVPIVHVRLAKNTPPINWWPQQPSAFSVCALNKSNPAA